ncbi:hypothetical protein B0T10DRAFT_404503 [Thelonectria olida]|uniref:Methyltransferase domain-containing protein n=1 Tax=Thelonectria olida TaxID=1576542 RepID=A0A9P8W600_9HYPO|nr:hypothetical protein B0T10DRAFT_404503 [Thelonectria olida]
MPADFEKQSYWHDRFASETKFEWLLSSEDFLPLIEPVLSQLAPDTARILHLGFGTSDLQNHLRKRGFANVLNVDYEPLAETRGRELELQAFGDVQMRYAVQDATQLHLGPDDKFDLVLDKSTVDAVSCAGEAPLRRMAARIRECVAGPDSVWVSLSYSAWRFDIDDLPFDVEILSKVLTPKLKPTDPDVFYYCYLLRPKRDAASARPPEVGNR